MDHTRVATKPDVTAEMRTEGAKAAGDACYSIFQSRWPEDIAAQIAVAAYQAMYAMAPVELVTEAERTAQTTIMILSEAAEQSRAEIVHLHLAIVARESQIAELNTLLAARPAPVSDPPKPNPFRDHSRDMRRIGG